MKKYVFSCIVVLSLGIIFCTINMNKSNRNDNNDVNKSYKIGVILKAMDSEHWYTVRSGLQYTSKEMGVTTLILYPENEASAFEQKEIFDDLVKRDDIDAIAIAPCDESYSKYFEEMAIKYNKPLFAIDTKVNEYVPYIGSDNENIGKMAGEYLKKLLNNEGKVVIISGVHNQKSHMSRIKGFVEYIEKNSKIEVVTIKYADSDFKKANLIAKEIYEEYGKIDGIFSTSAVMGLGVSAFYKREIPQELKPAIVAVDTQTDSIAALKNNDIEGLISQEGYEIGSLCIKTIKNYLDGREINPSYYISNILLTNENIESYLHKYLNREEMP